MTRFAGSRGLVLTGGLRAWAVVVALAVAMPCVVAAQTVPGADGAVNALRDSAGLPRLAPDQRLQGAAERHAADMMRGNYFSHRGRDGSRAGDRARASGYGYCYVSENIAKGQRALDDVLRAWMASASHRKNILNRKARHYALARSSDNTWVMMLGADGC